MVFRAFNSRTIAPTKIVKFTSGAGDFSLCWDQYYNKFKVGPGFRPPGSGKNNQYHARSNLLLTHLITSFPFRVLKRSNFNYRNPFYCSNMAFYRLKYLILKKNGLKGFFFLIFGVQLRIIKKCRNSSNFERRDQKFIMGKFLYIKLSLWAIKKIIYWSILWPRIV